MNINKVFMSTHAFVPHNLPIFEGVFSKPRPVLPAIVLPPFELMATMAAMEQTHKTKKIKTPGPSLIDFLWEHKYRLSGGIFGTFVVCYTFMVTLGLVPDSLTATPNPQSAVLASAILANPIVEAPAVVPPTATSTETSNVATSSSTIKQTKVVVPKTVAQTVNTVSQNPTRIVISKIGVDVLVSNPSSAKAAVLDEKLKHGAVRYPGSAALGEGNTFIFGHSTNHAVVVNQAYKAFNGFDKLLPGDTVTAYSLDRVYTYKVERVRLAMADEVYVDLSTSKNMLTLSTCNTFGEKEERYVVEASFVSSEVLVEETI